MVVWEETNTTSLQPRVNAQKRVMRTMTGFSRNVPTIYELNIFKNNEIEQYFSLLFVPCHTSNYFTYLVNQRYALNRYRGPKTLNKLEHVRNCTTILSNKKLSRPCIMSFR